MNSKKVAETIQQTREWARAEYETKTRGLIFTKDFQSRQEALMHDPLATVGERVMAWILRRSWGEMVLYAMKEDGEPAYQRDCAKELRIDKKQVSNAVGYYQKRGYLENHPKKLYPVISPALSSPDPNCKKSQKKSQEFVTFCEQWKVTHSSDFQELEVARSTIKKINKVLLSEYKKWRQEKQTAAASLLKTEESISETGQRAAVSPIEAQNAPAETPPPEEGVITAADASALVFSQITAMQKSFPNTPFAKPAMDPNNAGDVGLVGRILRELGARRDGRYDEQYVIGYFIHVSAKFKGLGLGGGRKSLRDPASPSGPKTVGLLVNWAQDYARMMGRGGGGEAA